MASKYKTHQREVLFSFFSKNPHESYSAKELINMLSDNSISVSSVYRNLSLLEEEKLIARVVKEQSKEVFYKYVKAPECQTSVHLHCCLCDKTFHLSEKSTQSLLKSLKANDDFLLAYEETLLHGTCKDCIEKSR